MGPNKGMWMCSTRMCPLQGGRIMIMPWEEKIEILRDSNFQEFFTVCP